MKLTPVQNESPVSFAETEIVATNDDADFTQTAANYSQSTYAELLAKAAYCIKNEKDWPVAKAIRQARRAATTEAERVTAKFLLKTWWKFCDLSGDYTDLLLASSEYYANRGNESVGWDLGRSLSQPTTPFEQSYEGFTAKGDASRLVQSLNIFLENLETQGRPDFYEAYFYRCRSLQTAISKKFKIEFTPDDHFTSPNTQT